MVYSKLKISFILAIFNYHSHFTGGRGGGEQGRQSFYHMRTLLSAPTIWSKSLLLKCGCCIETSFLLVVISNTSISTNISTNSLLLTSRSESQYFGEVGRSYITQFDKEQHFLRHRKVKQISQVHSYLVEKSGLKLRSFDNTFSWVCSFDLEKGPHLALFLQHFPLYFVYDCLFF